MERHYLALLFADPQIELKVWCQLIVPVTLEDEGAKESFARGNENTTSSRRN